MASEGMPSGYCAAFNGICPNRLAADKRLYKLSSQIEVAEKKRRKVIHLPRGLYVGIENKGINPALENNKVIHAEQEAVLAMNCNRPCMVEQAEGAANFRYAEQGKDPFA